MKNKKVFIFDVDGVLLNLWIIMRFAYAEFHKKEISEEEWDEIIEDFLHDPLPYLKFGDYFDHSKWFASLPPLNDEMLHFPTYLKANGFDIVIVTSTNDKPEVVEARKQNLHTVYGNIFDKIIFVGRANSKEEALKSIAEKYEVSFFCDDSLKNICKAKAIVTHPIWFENKHHLFMLNNMDVADTYSAANVSTIKKIIVRSGIPLSK